MSNPSLAGESKILPAKSLPKLIIRAKGQVETPQLTPSFSDYEYLDPVTTEERLDFAHPSLSHKILRSLRRGQEPLEASLDLHGQTVEAARFSLQQFLTECQKTGKCQVFNHSWQRTSQSKTHFKKQVKSLVKASARSFSILFGNC